MKLSETLCRLLSSGFEKFDKAVSIDDMLKDSRQITNPVCVKDDGL